ncbi:very short patch repair endonuclease [Pseudomonas lini]|uniref:Very short patch repair endonuclease n=1 Tax=Pseudomonas lini TaxID=163011 RepID=A0A423IF54_9PSED|nr:very short patch repair endonuclease [Pseudomonas lini]RON24082.1 very short patch repair endonuclease [Pseudomonas lini]
MCTDIVTPEQRSRLMAQIKGKNTKPELIIRSLCHEMGLRFRLHRKDLPGTPDLVFPRYRLCIFVHGCFWHRHIGCKYSHTPKSRHEFWSKKFNSNATRDEQSINKLKLMDWRVEVIWECELKDIDRIEERIYLLTKTLD